jgi:hypothetical protein
MVARRRRYSTIIFASGTLNDPLVKIHIFISGFLRELFEKYDPIFTCGFLCHLKK